MSQTTGVREDADLPRKSTTNTTITPEPRNALDRFFEITKRGSSIPQEIRGGVVTFFAMAYIVILNPIILSGVSTPSATPSTSRRSAPSPASPQA